MSAAYIDDRTLSEIMSEPFICSVCGSNECVIDEMIGEVCCTRCGSVEATFVPSTYAPKYPDNEDPTKSWHMETSRRGLGTVYGKNTRMLTMDLRDETAKDRLKHFRLHRLDKSKEDSARTMMYGEAAVRRMTEKLNLPERVANCAIDIFNEAYKKHDIVRGRSIRRVASACVVLACRELNVPVSPRRIQQEHNSLYNTKGWSIQRLVNLMIKKGLSSVKRRLRTSDYARALMKKGWFDGHPHALRFFSDFIQIIESNPRELTGSYAGNAAAVMYIVSRIYMLKATQEDIARALFVSSMTIRNRMKTLLENYTIEVML